MIKISIIIPAYNAQAWIKRCVDSIQINNTDSSVECIIIDDGSTDYTGSLCELLAEGSSAIRVFHTENCGVSNARNQGLRMALGEWIMFLDADDELLADWYNKVNSLLNEDDIYIFRYIKQTKGGRRQAVRYSGCQDSGRKADELLLTTSLLNECWGKLYRKAFLLKYDIWFDTRLQCGEDFLFFMNCCRNSDRVCFCEPEIMVYYYNNNSAMHRRNLVQRIDDNNFLLEKRLEYARIKGLTDMIQQIYVLSFCVITNLALEISSEKEAKQLYAVIMESNYTRKVFQHLKYGTLPLLKRAEYFILQHMRWLGPIYFWGKSIVYSHL